MENNLEVANTIRSQIRALDFWALGGWGANQYIGSGPGDICFDGQEIIRTQGYLKFQVKGSKFRGWILIALNAKDTYDIYAYTIRKIECKLRHHIEGIYCDQLVEILDDLIGQN